MGKPCYLYELAVSIWVRSGAPYEVMRNAIHRWVYRFIALAAIWVVAHTARAQQQPQYLLTPYTLAVFNPATAGLDGRFSAAAVLRRQWQALPGHPEGLHVHAQLPLPAWSSGVGLVVIQDRVGLSQQVEATGTYSYYIPLSRQWRLGAGVAGGLLQAGLDGDGLRTPDGVYGGVGGPDHQDSRLPNGAVTGMRSVLHGGLFLEGRHWTVGLAGRQLQGGRLKYGGQASGMALVPHGVWHLGYRYAGGSWDSQTILAGRTDGKEWQQELSTYWTWRDRFVLGGGMRGLGLDPIDAWALSAGVRFSERFLLMYAFERGISPLRQAHRGSFELMLRYDLEISVGRGNLPPRIYNPRFL